MGLFEDIFGSRKKTEKIQQVKTSYKTLTAYEPSFTSWNGMLYESELIRAACDAKARHISKLKVELTGTAQTKLQNKIKARPNKWQTWSQFLYRASTILDMQNTAIIVPVLGDMQVTTGFFPVLPSRCKLLETTDGVLWLEFQFSNGQTGAVEFDRCGILTKFQYDDDVFGADNLALSPTMDLIHLQEQGIKEAIKNGATYRFWARENNFSSPEDLVEEQKRFSEGNFKDEAGGLLLFPNTYDEIHEVSAHPFSVDTEQMKHIQTNVFNYFGVNEKVLQNTAIGDELDGFYEGIIEPFAVQLAEVMTNMIYTENEQARGNEVIVSSNRLQYMKTSEKVVLVKEFLDRGVLMVDEGREIMNLPPLPNGEGQHVPIRGEFYFVDEKEDENGNQE